MQKSPLQYGEIIFQSKVIPIFLPKHSYYYLWYIVYLIWVTL